MNKILVFLLLGFVLSKDLIMIGDSRIMDMANMLFGIPLGYFYDQLVYKTEIIATESPFPYEDYEIHVTAIKDINFILKADELANKFVHQQLSGAKEGTNVLLSLGTDNLDWRDTIFNFCGRLADKYPNLNFYLIPVIGLRDPTINSSIIEFNTNIKNHIEVVGFDNLKFKDILKEDNPSVIMVGDQEIDITLFFSEGNLFFKNGYSKIFSAMVEGL